MDPCPFCNLSITQIIAQNDLAIAIYDKFPVNEGHILIISKRHFAYFFDATVEEMMALWELISKVKKELDERFKPDGYNVGVNVGEAAGQTIFHLHIHVIPHYKGDVDSPRGGIRKIKPSLVPYLEES